MEVNTNIPSRLRIANHWCNIHYKGQKQVCFRCHTEGHQAANCPSLPSREQQRAVDGSVESGEVANRDILDQERQQAVDGAAQPGAAANVSQVEMEVVNEALEVLSQMVEVLDEGDIPAAQESPLLFSESLEEGETAVFPKVVLPSPTRARRKRVHAEGSPKVGRTKKVHRGISSGASSSSGVDSSDEKGGSSGSDESCSQWEEVSEWAPEDVPLSDEVAGEMEKEVAPEDVPLPDVTDDGLNETELRLEITDTPLTQFTPNLPRAQQGSHNDVGPEYFQFSEENNLAQRLFFESVKPSPVHSEGGKSGGDSQ